MNDSDSFDKAQSVEYSDAVVPVAVHKPVVTLLTTSITKGRQIRHWIVACVSDLESGVLFTPLASNSDEAIALAHELVYSPYAYEVEEQDHAFVVTYDIGEKDEISIPLIWRGHPVRTVTMDSPVAADPKVVLCRYRSRMSKELRVYRGDLSEEDL